MEPVSDGLSAHGMCVFATSQRESQLEHLILLLLNKTIVISVTGAAF